MWTGDRQFAFRGDSEGERRLLRKPGVQLLVAVHMDAQLAVVLVYFPGGLVARERAKFSVKSAISCG